MVVRALLRLAESSLMKSAYVTEYVEQIFIEIFKENKNLTIFYMINYCFIQNYMFSFKNLRSINFTNILFMTTFFYSENPLNYHINCCVVGTKFKTNPVY